MWIFFDLKSLIYDLTGISFAAVPIRNSHQLGTNCSRGIAANTTPTMKSAQKTSTLVKMAECAGNVHFTQYNVA
jgi:hypothetical protein